MKRFIVEIKMHGVECIMHQKLVYICQNKDVWEIIMNDNNG